MPKLKFIEIPLDLEVSIISDFINKKSSFTKYIFDMYPELKDKNVNEFIIKLREEKKDLIKLNIERYSNAWKEKENIFYDNLQNILNCELDNITYKAMLSMNPINPRYLKQKSFNIFYNTNRDYMFSIVAHELTHFLYFKKFKELFPNISEKNYDTPYLEWVLSEILVSIILNDSRFNDFFKEKQKSYDVFYNSKIDNKTIMEIFEDKYNQMIEKDHKKFDDYLTWAYDYAKKHEKQLMVVN